VQGVEEGIESYDRMVLLVSSWRKQKKDSWIYLEFLMTI
jgi:hypothetical protein